MIWKKDDVDLKIDFKMPECDMENNAKIDLQMKSVDVLIIKEDIQIIINWKSDLESFLILDL